MRTAVITTLAALAALALAGCASTETGETEGGGGGTTAESETTAEPKASIKLVPRKSICVAFPALAKISFILAFRNNGDAPGEPPAVIPVRRYSDGQTNASPVDELTFDTVKPGETRRFSAEFDYRATEHDLLECWAEIDGRRIPLKVTGF
jgi:hypothetical protein